MSRYSGFVPVYLSSCDSVDLTSVWTCLLEVLKYFYGVYSIKFLSWSPAINQDISHKSVEKVYLLSSVLCSSAIGHCSPDI